MGRCAKPRRAGVRGRLIVRRATLALVLVSSGLGLGCRTWPGHLVGRSAPSAYEPQPGLDEPTPTAGDAQIEQLVVGRHALRDAITRLSAMPLPGTPEPRFVALPELEQALRKRYRGGTALGPVRGLVALGMIGWAPRPPDEIAGLWVHPGVMQRVLAARRVTPLGSVRRWPGTARRTLWIEKTGVGAGPLQFALRFAIAMERVDLANGHVWVRSDTDTAVRSEKVTLWRGLLHATPIGDGRGTRIAEVIVIGTDVQTPPFLKPVMREKGLKTLRDSRINLMKRARR